MGKDLVLAIDQGTTGTTCLLVNEDLKVEHRATVEFPQHFPNPGLVEHDPGEIWDSVRKTLGLVTKDGSTEITRRIRAIGVTNQRETCMVWQRESSAMLGRALVWQDRRTAKECKKLSVECGDRIRETTGLVADPYFSGTKLARILDDHQGARSSAASGKLAGGTVDTFLIWKLTGGKVHATDPSNASRTMLWPLEGGGWSKEMGELLRVPLEILPQVRPSCGDFGRTAGVPFLPDGIEVAGVLGDQQAALFGQACFEKGGAKCTYGTGAFAMLNTGRQPVVSKRGLLTTVGWDLGEGPVYCLEGSAFMAGAAVQWLRDGLGIIDRAEDVEALAASVPDSGGVVAVPAHAGLGAPYWRPDARGLIGGLSRGSTKAHIARAVLEGVAMQVAKLLEAMEEDSGADLRGLKVDGGAARNDLLMQLQSDLCGLSLERPSNTESTAMGAVFAAGLRVGVWSSLEEIASAREIDRVFQPRETPTDLEGVAKRWETAVEKI